MGNIVAKSTLAAGRQEELVISQTPPDSNVEILLPDASKVAPDIAKGVTAKGIKGQSVTVKSKHHADASATASKKTVAGQVVPAVEIAASSTNASPAKATQIAEVEQNVSVPAAVENSVQGPSKPAQEISKALNGIGSQVGHKAEASAVEATMGNVPVIKGTDGGSDGIQLKIVEPQKQAGTGKIELPRDVKISGEQIKVASTDNNVTVARGKLGTMNLIKRRPIR
jgi:hypothetical protein